jgi:cell division protein FtsI (penicillin-binding protein 3)
MDTRSRLAAAAALSLLPVVPLTYRLAQLQVFQHRTLDNKAAGEFSRSSEEVIPRADVLDRDGRVLAQSMPVWSVFVDKRMVTRAEPVASQLAPLLRLPASEVARRYRTGGQRAAFIRRDLSFEESQAVAKAKIEGVGLESGQQRFYPNGDLARSVLGQVSSDGRGVAGVELALDGRLSGSARRFKVIRDGAGKTIYRSVEKDEAAPEPLRLTLDRNIQYIAEEALSDAARKFSATQGIAVIEDPNNGEILAMAVYPNSPLKNPIVQDTYEPGSTFKAVTAAAALEENAVKDDEQIFCENGAWEVAPGTVVHDHEPQGNLTLQGILEQSSNIGAGKVGLRLGAATLLKYARAFGFASKTGVALPGETAGELRPLPQMTRVGLASASYGYGVAVSALQVLGAYSAIANGGTLYEPHLLKDAAPVKVRRVASARTMERLTRMLEGVVEHGTGEPARIPGYRIAGKTGTARRIDAATHKYSQSQYNASFAGFLPASKPRWAVLVVLENPRGSYYGSQTSAPVFAAIARQLLALKGVAPDKEPTVQSSPAPKLTAVPAPAPVRAAAPARAVAAARPAARAR